MGIAGICGTLPQVIAEKMLDYLRSLGDEVQKADVAKRIGELAERFAPDTQWFIDTMNQARKSRSLVSNQLTACQVACAYPILHQCRSQRHDAIKHACPDWLH